MNNRIILPPLESTEITIEYSPSSLGASACSNNKKSNNINNNINNSVNNKNSNNHINNDKILIIRAARLFAASRGRAADELRCHGGSADCV